MRTRDEILKTIADERQRQIDKEGWTFLHDDRWDHIHGEMAQAAAVYAMPDTATKQPAWPRNWLRRYNKKHKHPRKRQLEIAAALILAELERLERWNNIERHT
jgi:hypothetical protein